MPTAITPPNSHYWFVQPSAWQARLDAIFLSCTWLLLIPLLSPILLAFLACALGGLYWVVQRQRAAFTLSCSVQGWQRNRLSQPLNHPLTPVSTEPLRWRSGSIKRPQLIVWRYGFWPWQHFIVRPDSLPTGEFAQLQRALALSVLRT